jgi:hypothetical protein
MDLEETKTRNVCNGEGQQLFNRQTDSGASRELTAAVGSQLRSARELAAEGSTSWSQ